MDTLKSRIRTVLAVGSTVFGGVFLAASQEHVLSAREAFQHPAFEVLAACYQMCVFDYLF